MANKSINDVTSGLANYCDLYILPNFKENSIQRVAAGVAISLLLKNASNIAHTMCENSMVKAFGIIDENGNVDVTTLKEVIKSQIPDTGVVVDTKFCKMTFKRGDIDLMYECITGEVPVQQAPTIKSASDILGNN